VLSESVVAILLRKQVGGFAEHKRAKTHWSKKPSTVNCPNVPGMQCVCVCEDLGAHIGRVMNRV